MGRGLLAAGLAAGLLAFGLWGAAVPVGAIPPLPSSFWGMVTLDGAFLEAGATIEALIGGTPYAATAIRLVGEQAVYTVNVPGDDPTTAAIEGGREGDALQWRVGGTVYPQASTWRGGTNTRLDMTAVTVRWDADAYLVSEGDGMVRAGVVLGAPWPEPLRVPYATRPGTAGPADYVPVEGELLLAPGETAATIVVTILDDALDEPDERFTLTLGPVEGAVVASPREARVVIYDDDDPPAVALERREYAVDPAQGALEVGVMLSAPSGKAVEVGYATADGTALAGQHYVGSTGVVRFAPGETQQTLEIVLLEGNEGPVTFTVALADPVNAVWGTPRQATVTIGRLPPVFLPLVRRG